MASQELEQLFIDQTHTLGKIDDNLVEKAIWKVVTSDNKALEDAFFDWVLKQRISLKNVILMLMAGGTNAYSKIVNSPWIQNTTIFDKLIETQSDFLLTSLAKQPNIPESGIISLLNLKSAFITAELLLNKSVSAEKVINHCLNDLSTPRSVLDILLQQPKYKLDIFRRLLNSEHRSAIPALLNNQEGIPDHLLGELADKVKRKQQGKIQNNFPSLTKPETLTHQTNTDLELLKRLKGYLQ